LLLKKTTYIKAAQVTAKADVRYLLLTHILPPLPSTLLHNVFLGDAKKIYKGKIDIGRDRMLISLPANSENIKTNIHLGKRNYAMISFSPWLKIQC
jgi:hypothetical protein